VDMIEDRPVVDVNWCLGCGVCAPVCPAGAITLYRRFEQNPPQDFQELHQCVKREKTMVSGKA
jgi:Fe-S-cluster-containing hydrogenase component 2